MPTPSPHPPPPPGGVPDPGTRPPGSTVPTPSPSPGTAPGTPPAPGRTDDGGLLSGLSDITSAVAAVRQWTGNRHNWVRVTWFTSGLILIAVGAVMLTGKPAATAAATVLPAGKLIKGATK